MRSFAHVYRRMLITLMQLFKGNDPQSSAVACLSAVEIIVTLSLSAIIAPDSFNVFIANHGVKTEVAIFGVLIVILNNWFLNFEKKNRPLDPKEANFDFLTLLFLPAVILFVWSLIAVYRTRAP